MIEKLGSPEDKEFVKDYLDNFSERFPNIELEFPTAMVAFPKNTDVFLIAKTIKSELNGATTLMKNESFRNAVEDAIFQEENY